MIEHLRRRLGETVNLMELEDDEIVYVLRYPGYHAVSVDLHVGSRLPAGSRQYRRAVATLEARRRAGAARAAAARDGRGGSESASAVRAATMIRTLATGAILACVGYLAVCALLYFAQRSFIYYPVPRQASVPVTSLLQPDADIVVSTNGLAGERAVIYFGGNAEDVSQSVVQLAEAFPGAAIHAMHYRGYGGSTGSPSERALVGDGLGLHDQVAARHRQVVVVGRSLGSGIAIQVAAARPVQRLVLVTPFDSLAELAATQFRLFPTRWLLQDTYESWRYAAALTMPVTVIIAGRDEVIPKQSSLRLAAALPQALTTRVEIADTGHNDLSQRPEYLAALRGEAGPAGNLQEHGR